MGMKRTALTIAGSDSGGGAGIQADLKTFSALGVYGMSAITAITAQNTQGVYDVVELPVDSVVAQIDAVFSDLPVHAVKVGMVSNAEIIKGIAIALKKYPVKHLVIDPVMISKSGCHLLKPEAQEALIKELIPLADLLTPNLPEASALVGRSITNLDEMRLAAQEIIGIGCKTVLIKGGHLDGKPIDLLYDGEKEILFTEERIDSKSTHGTGCTYSSAIAAYLAKGCLLKEAIAQSKEYITGAIRYAVPLGSGSGPTHHFWQWDLRIQSHKEGRA